MTHEPQAPATQSRATRAELKAELAAIDPDITKVKKRWDDLELEAADLELEMDSLLGTRDAVEEAFDDCGGDDEIAT